VRVALLLLVTACWSNSQSATQLPPPQPTEPVASSSSFRSRPPRTSCRTTVDRLAEKLRPEFAKSSLPVAMLDELVETSIESCLGTDWSPDLHDCFDRIDDSNALTGCQSLMTTEQSEDLQRRWIDVISRMNQQPGPTTP
jgi:hypothetical protein